MDMTKNPRPDIRIADADRESVAERIRTAAAEGRLTLAESDERQAAAYAALTAEDLRPLVADLPRPVVAADTSLTEDAKRRLTTHAMIVGVLGLLIVTGSIVGAVVGFGAPFVPVFPLFWLALSVLVHYRIARRRSIESRRNQPVPAW
jgi:hypothetical protein